MAYKLKTALGKAIYGACTCTVEPMIGIIKEVLGFRQFSLRGEQAGIWQGFIPGTAIWAAKALNTCSIH